MRLRWTGLAEDDLNNIADYIGQDSPAAAARVILELMIGPKRRWHAIPHRVAPDA